MTALLRPVVASTLAAALLLSTAPLDAQPALGGMITGMDIDRIAQIASTYGPAARQPDDDQGPWIRGELDGTIYTISFLNCQQATNCTSIQFRAWWNSEGAHTLEMMNDWNRQRRFSDAYIDSRGNATIEYDVNLAGGVTAVNFDDTVQWWQAVLREFRSSVIDPGYEAADPGPEMPPVPPGGQPPGLSK
jgi:hypothetical protein